MFIYTCIEHQQYIRFIGPLPNINRNWKMGMQCPHLIINPMFLRREGNASQIQFSVFFVYVLAVPKYGVRSAAAFPFPLINNRDLRQTNISAWQPFFTKLMVLDKTSFKVSIQQFQFPLHLNFTQWNNRMAWQLPNKIKLDIFLKVHTICKLVAVAFRHVTADIVNGPHQLHPFPHQ